MNIEKHKVDESQSVEASEISEIITSQDIQNAYLKFYPYMMQYLWSINTVMNLANLEISIFKRFPEKEEMQEYIDKLESDIKDTFNDEDNLDSSDFKKTFDTLKDYIDTFDEDAGYEVYSVKEDIDLDEIKGESELDDDSEDISGEGEPEPISELEEPGKRKIKIGKIVKK